MKDQSTGFDMIASFYDPMARMVFQRSITDSQLFFLSLIPERAKVLILGGGTGWLLASLLKQKPDCEVWYVETSGRMIRMAMAQTAGDAVHFHHGTFQEITEKDFDVVITNFFLDLFPTTVLQEFVPSISSMTRESMIWIAVDFVDGGKWWQKILLRAMYLFFVTVCGIQANKLPEWRESLSKSGLKQTQSKDFYREFIKATVWMRSSG